MRSYALLTLSLLGFVVGCVTSPVSPAVSTAAATQKGSAAFKRSGQQMVVEGIVNRKVRANFLVDTGADLTIIPLATAKALGIILQSKLPTVRLQTLADSIYLPLVVLDSLEVGGMEVNDVTVAVHDSPIFDPYLPDPPGLLGRNFLNYFRMQIDLNEGFLKLEKK